MQPSTDNPSAVVFPQPDTLKGIYPRYIKRFIDFCLALIALLVLAPIMLLIVILVRIDSPGGPLFVQERLGHRGKTFKILKFRTMIVNAENIGDGVFIYDEKTDPRITKVGRALRKTTLDELPQLINILKGDMSFVGPRPPVTYFPYEGHDLYPDWAKSRFFVRPGLTGLAQIAGRHDICWEERFPYDVKYVNHVSLRYDSLIVFYTLIYLLKKGSIDYMQHLVEKL